MNELKNEILKKASMVGQGEKFLAIILGEKLCEECCFLKKLDVERKEREEISLFISNENSLVVLYFKTALKNLDNMDPYFKFLSNKNITATSIYSYSDKSKVIEMDITEDFTATKKIAEEFKEKAVF